MSDFSDLQKRIIKFRNARDWKQFHNPKDVTLSLVLEASELLEHFQWKNPQEMQEHLKKHKREVSEEVADILYWVILFSYDANIDPIEALERKILINEKKYPVNKARGTHKKYTEL